MNRIYMIEMDAKGGTETWFPIEFRSSEDLAARRMEELLRDNGAEYRVRAWVRE